MDTKTFWNGHYVSDADLNGVQTNAQNADFAIITDHDLDGVATGLTATEHYTGTTSTPNLTVDVAVGTAYDDTGRRIRVGTAQNVSLATDYTGASTAVAAGNHRGVSPSRRGYGAPYQLHAHRELRVSRREER